MNQNLKNFIFLKDTVQKFKGELQRFVANSNGADPAISKLRTNIEEIEKTMNKQEKSIVNNLLSQQRTLTNTHEYLYCPERLPVISQRRPMSINYIPEDDIYTSLKYVKKTSIERPFSKDTEKKYLINKKAFEEERKIFIRNMQNRNNNGRIKEENRRRLSSYKRNKETENLLTKFGINSDIYNNIKVTNKMPNFMDPMKRIKYSNLSKTAKAEIVLYDKNHQPIIRKDELSKGLYNMITKGLIPKGADLSPAFENNGNPLQINMKMRDDLKIKLDANKDDLDFDMKQNYRNKKVKEDTNENSGGFFITKAQTGIQRRADMPEVFENQGYGNIEEDSNNINNNTKKSLNYNNSSSNIQRNNEQMLIFSNYVPLQNDEYKLFYKENLELWGSISYLFEHLSKLFKKLNLNLVDIYQKRILDLAKDETKIISNKDLLSCISERDLKVRGLDINDRANFYQNISDRFALRIQLAFRRYIARKKLKKIKGYFEKIKLIQGMYRAMNLVGSSRKKAKNLFEMRYENWKKMQNNFKKKWELVKSMTRVEIHFNTVSINHPEQKYMNTTIDKFNERQNNQLNRIVGLEDNSLEIIYISGHEINEDIITYYSSIMQTFGIKNVKERFHIIVPSAAKVYPIKSEAKLLPSHFSVSELLMLSPDTLKEVKTIIGTREAYIVPGTSGKTEMEISMLLDVPILMGDLFQSETIFTKSGSKLVFEGNDIEVPVSAWDIKTEEEFYSSLSHLVTNFPQYNTWLIKLDNEKNGRGIAYIQLDKIQQYNELLKKRSLYVDLSKYEVILMDILKNMLPKKIKIAANFLYKTWEEFFKNYLLYRGVIEACPTFSPNQIAGSPCIPLFIEPNGTINFLSTYDKVNLGCFRNIGAVSPQQTIKGSKEPGKESGIVGNDSKGAEGEIPINDNRSEEISQILDKKEQKYNKEISESAGDSSIKNNNNNNNNNISNSGSNIINEQRPNVPKINMNEIKGNVNNNNIHTSNKNINNENNKMFNAVQNNNNNSASVSQKFSSFRRCTFDITEAGERIGKYLYEHDIMGYVTIELITFNSKSADDNNLSNSNNSQSQKDKIPNLSCWAIDLKFGLTDLTSSLNFCYFLYSHSFNLNTNPDINTINISLNRDKYIENEKYKMFTFPFFSHERIAEIKMKELVKAFRDEKLIFDVEKRRGIVFNFSDVLECGSMGLCGIIDLEEFDIQNEELELWKMIQSSMHLIVIGVKLNEFQPIMNEDIHTDHIDIADVFNKINKHYNVLLIKDKKRRQEQDDMF